MELLEKFRVEILEKLPVELVVTHSGTPRDSGVIPRETPDGTPSKIPFWGNSVLFPLELLEKLSLELLEKILMKILE